MKNHFSSKINRLVIALTGVLVLSIGSAYAGSAYSDGRAYLRQGSPSGAGKVYVSTSSSTPAASSYKACNTIQTSETTTPSASAQVKGEKTKTTYHFWAVATPDISSRVGTTPMVICWVPVRRMSAGRLLPVRPAVAIRTRISTTMRASSSRSR